MSDRDKAGRFAKGNRLWEARSSAGPKPKFKDPDQLWSACVEYFEWVEANPLIEARPFSYQGAVTIAHVAKMRAMTIGGLCIFLDIDETTWRDWKETRPDLSPIIARVERVIRDQKFGGAAADLLNANIIARDLGLADKSELTGKDGGPIQTEEVSARDRIASRLARLSAGSDTQGDTGGPE